MRNVFLEADCGRGIVYGLFAEDEPSIIRYVGQTKYEPIIRLRSHHCEKSKNTALRDWVQSSRGAGIRIGMRILGYYPIDLLTSAETAWVAHYIKIGPLFNWQGASVKQMVAANSSSSALRYLSAESVLYPE